MLANRPTRQASGGEWIRVCRSIDVVHRRGHRVELDIEHDIALFRVNGSVQALTNVCPHKREAAIFDGVVVNGTVTCPIHAWCFDIVTGKNAGAGGSLRTYPVEETNGYVWVFIAESPFG